MDRGGMRGWVSLFWECESDFRSITSMKTIQKAELNYSTIQIHLCDTPLLQIAESRPVSHTPVNCQNIPPLPGKLINCLRLVVQQWKTGLGGGSGWFQRLEPVQPFVLRPPVAVVAFVRRQPSVSRVS